MRPREARSFFMNRTVVKFSMKKSVLHQKPGFRDIIILFIFAVFITWQPFFRYGEMNVFELGLYLPGINSVLNGGVPFRDFFHLRGPFEIYMPAGMMALFGAQVSILQMYFYFGSVLTLLLSILIGKEFYRTRYVLYLMTVVLVARTFPRVVYAYWGGMRYALGLAALLCAVRYFKRDRLIWIFLSGVASVCAFFTSIEVGVCSLSGIFAALIFSWFFKIDRRAMRIKAFGAYTAGLALVGIPYSIYMASVGALVSYVEGVYSVLTKMEYTFNPHLISGSPPNFIMAIPHMFNAAAPHFKHATPFYFVIVAGIFLMFHIKRNGVTKAHESFVCVLVYFLVMYASSFRSIGSAQFEMALQPEKILLFFVLERVYFFLRRKKSHILQRTKSYFPRRVVPMGNYLKLYGILFLMAGFLGSSVGYSCLRYSRRFFGFQLLAGSISGKEVKLLKSFSEKNLQFLSLSRAQGVVVPAEQALEIESVVRFIQKETKEDEVVFTYPELGTYSFLADRPSLGRFPYATFSWFQDEWHDELVADFIREKPRYVIVSRDLTEERKIVYFNVKANREKYDEVLGMIRNNYNLERTTPESYIYKRKSATWRSQVALKIKKN